MASDTRNKTEQHDWSMSPFALMRQGIDEMDRWFSRMTGDRSTTVPWAPGRSSRSWTSERTDWSPAIEAFQRGTEFVVRAEVPGMKRNEISLEAGDDSLTIRGERRQEQTQEREGMFWTERSYGSFCRVIPLPPGTIADSAKATFNNGVLEVVMQAPSHETRRGRKIDISGGASEHESKK
jgi:HSP20 family protein